MGNNFSMTEVCPKPIQIEKNAGSNIMVNQNSVYIFNATFRKSAELGELLLSRGLGDLHFLSSYRFSNALFILLLS